MNLATSNFLIPNGTLIIEIVVFLVLLALVGKWGLPRAQQAMTERQARIREELEAADRARSDAMAADDERRRELEEARHHAREIVAQANRTAEQVLQESEARAQAEYDRRVAAAELEVDRARQRAVAEASARLGEMVMDVVGRIIGREVDAEAHRDLIDEAITAIERGDPAGAGSAPSGGPAR